MKTFNSVEKLESYVKTLSMVEKKAIAQEENLVDAKVATIVEHFAPTHVIETETETTAVKLVAENNEAATTTEQTEDDNQSDNGTQVNGEKSEAKKEEDEQPTFSEEELVKVAKHYKGKVAALQGMLDEIVGTYQKLTFMDGKMLNVTGQSLHPTSVSTFSIDVSSLPSGYFSTEENIKSYRATFDIKALALASYDGSFKFDGKPITQDVIKLALSATVSEHDKMESAIEKLRESEEYKLAVSTYAIFREQMLAAIAKHSVGAELSSAFEIRNPHRKTSAKGNNTSAISKASADGETRTYTRHEGIRIIKGALNIAKTMKDKGKMTLTTSGNGQWKLTASDNDGQTVGEYDSSGEVSLSKATTMLYQKVTQSHGQKSVYAFWGEENFIDA